MLLTIKLTRFIEHIDSRKGAYKMRVFIIESASPLDIMDGTSESAALENICKMMGHKVVTFFSKSEREFSEICNYISSIDCVVREGKDEPICIHLTSHGSENGILFGRDDLTWDDITQYLNPIFKMDYNQDFFLVISACGTDNHKLHISMRKSVIDNKITPPKYIFSINEEEVLWRDAALIWTILYHQIENLNTDKQKEFQGLLRRVQTAKLGFLKYHRWDKKSKKFLSFSKKG